jgi:quercetin dioxygenase-like cupin family protein
MTFPWPVTGGDVIRNQALDTPCAISTWLQTVKLEPGDSWLVPANAEHSYRILETFTAVEATAPPAQAHGRDEG